MALNPIQSGIYSLLRKFISRQEIASELLKELRPDLMSTLGQKVVQPNKEYIQATQIGRWGENKEWSYFIHGRGCRLIHKTTGERIEWTAPDLKRFDPHWFVNWIEWALSKESEFEGIAVVRLYIEENNGNLTNLIFNTLDELQIMKKIIYYPKTTNMYAIRTT